MKKEHLEKRGIPWRHDGKKKRKKWQKESSKEIKYFQKHQLKTGKKKKPIHPLLQKMHFTVELDEASEVRIW